MQITLNQSEIEQALREFIHSQISVNEGVGITITLKATRGEEGTTAIIDITKPEPVSVGSVIVQAAEPEKATAPKPTRTVTAAKTEVVKDTPAPKTKVPEPVVEEQQGALPDPVVVDEPESVEETQLPYEAEAQDGAEAVAEASTQVGGATEEPAKPVSRAASLFSGLQKPKN